jgi:hypothetical protein
MEMTRTMNLGAVALLAIAAILSGRAAAQASSTPSDAAVDAYIKAMRADFAADKIALITDAMQFSDKDASAFWPIYQRYETEVAALNDERVRAIKTYADKYLTMTNDDAKSLAEKSFDLESRRTDLRKKYFVEFNKVLPALTVAKFYQLEHRLDLVVDVEIASELPSLLEKSPAASSETGQKKPN